MRVATARSSASPARTSGLIRLCQNITRSGHPVGGRSDATLLHIIRGDRRPDRPKRERAKGGKPPHGRHNERGRSEWPRRTGAPQARRRRAQGSHGRSNTNEPEDIVKARAARGGTRNLKRKKMSRRRNTPVPRAKPESAKRVPQEPEGRGTPGRRGGAGGPATTTARTRGVRETAHTGRGHKPRGQRTA